MEGAMGYRSKSVVWIAVVLAVFGLVMLQRGDLDPRVVITIFLVCFACELIDSGLGMGYGTILTPVLLALGWRPDQIVPTVLLSELLSGFAAAFFHHEIRNVELGWKGADLRPALLLAGGSVAGVSVGVMIALSLPKDVLTMTIGSIVLLSGIIVLATHRRVIAYRQWKMVTVAAGALFNKAGSGGGYGPLVTSGQILSGVRGKAAVGITSFAEAFTCLLAVVLFLWKGGFIEMALFVPMAAGALVSVPLSVGAIGRMHENLVRGLVGVVTIAMGAFTIWRAIA